MVSPKRPGTSGRSPPLQPPHRGPTMDPTNPTEPDTLNARVDAETSAWPPEARGADPGPADAAARVLWMETTRPAVERLRRAEAAAKPSGPYPFQDPADVAW